MKLISACKRDTKRLSRKRLPCFFCGVVNYNIKLLISTANNLKAKHPRYKDNQKTTYNVIMKVLQKKTVKKVVESTNVFSFEASLSQFIIITSVCQYFISQNKALKLTKPWSNDNVNYFKSRHNYFNETSFMKFISS